MAKYSRVEYHKVDVLREKGYMSISDLNYYGENGWVLCHVEEYASKITYVFYRK